MRGGSRASNLCLRCYKFRVGLGVHLPVEAPSPCQVAAFFFACPLIAWNTYHIPNSMRSQGDHKAMTDQSQGSGDEADPAPEAKPIPTIQISPTRMMHDYLTALSGGTMGKNPTAVATFLLTREIQRLIEAKHIRGDWF